MQTLPIITKRTQIDVQGINGQPIFTYYQQLLSLLKKEGQHDEWAHLFAEPVTNVMRGEVSWVTKLDGSVRPFDTLTAEEKLNVAKTLTQVCGIVRRVADKVETGAGSSAAYGAQALRAMLSTPDVLASIYMVGDQLVLTQWGCLPYGAQAHDHQFDTRFAQVFKPAAKVIASQKAAEVAAQSSPKIFGLVGIAQWLTLGALSLLFLAGLFYKQWLTVLDPGPSVQVEEGLRTQISDLWSKVEKKSAACVSAMPTQAPVTMQETPATVTSGEIDRRLKENSVAQGKFVNVTLAWKNQADLDLIVVEPGSIAISIYEDHVRKSASGGSLDIDANACQKMSGCQSKPDPVENISWNVKPPAGRYDVYVALFSANVASDRRENIPYTVVVTIDGKKTSYEGTINATDMVCGDRCRSKNKVKVASFVIS